MALYSPVQNIVIILSGWFYDIVVNSGGRIYPSSCVCVGGGGFLPMLDDCVWGGGAPSFYPC